MDITWWLLLWSVKTMVESPATSRMEESPGATADTGCAHGWRCYLEPVFRNSACSTGKPILWSFFVRVRFANGGWMYIHLYNLPYKLKLVMKLWTGAENYGKKGDCAKDLKRLHRNSPSSKITFNHLRFSLEARLHAVSWVHKSGRVN